MPIVLPGDEQGIHTACLLLRSGNLVVIPTETVYGLAANALDYDAVAAIFSIKGRPNNNPLIVHVHSIEQAGSVAEVSKEAHLLADAFWPGPLTIVMKAKSAVASNVTAGGPTVGLRMPNHLLTLKLLQSCGMPLAAPSANRSEGISPTQVQHVIHSLGPHSPAILDGGSCAVGIESTVVDVTERPVRILRPGAVTRAQIESVLGERVESGPNTEIARSPGQMLRHYAPTKNTFLARLPVEVSMLPTDSAIVYHSPEPGSLSHYVATRQLSEMPVQYAAAIYSALHDLDNDPAVEQIFIEMPPAHDDWTAVRDRLSRAASVWAENELDG